VLSTWGLAGGNCSCRREAARQQVAARLRDSVMGRNHFGHGPRAEPGLAEQVRLVLAWNAELGRGKKKDGEVEPHRRKPTSRLRARIDRG
jgi:hypothetical protein